MCDYVPDVRGLGIDVQQRSVPAASHSGAAGGHAVRRAAAVAGQYLYSLDYHL